MPQVQVNGISMYYDECGAGTPILLIMGFTANATAWEPQIAPLAAHHRVIAYDNRGAGRSDAPAGPYTMELLAADAWSLLDVLGIEKAHIYGISMGGMIAQHVYLQHPKRVLSLVLGCTTPGGPNAARADQEVVNTLLAATTMDPEAAFNATLPILYSDAFAAGNRELLFERAQANVNLRAPEAGVQGQMAAIVAHDTYERLPGITAPTLVLHGDDDHLVPTANGEILASRIPGARLVLYPGARHGYSGEFVTQSNQDVLDFFAAVPVKTGV